MYLEPSELSTHYPHRLSAGHSFPTRPPSRLTSLLSTTPFLQPTLRSDSSPTSPHADLPTLTLSPTDALARQDPLFLTQTSRAHLFSRGPPSSALASLRSRSRLPPPILTPLASARPRLPCLTLPSLTLRPLRCLPSQSGPPATTNQGPPHQRSPLHPAHPLRYRPQPPATPPPPRALTHPPPCARAAEPAGSDT